MSDAPECKSRQVRLAVIVTLGWVVVEAETADAAREKAESRGYLVLEVNRDASPPRSNGGMIFFGRTDVHTSKQILPSPCPQNIRRKALTDENRQGNKCPADCRKPVQIRHRSTRREGTAM